MALNIIAWNMQGERSAFGSPYSQMFSAVLPRLVNEAPNDTWLIYLSECGNPFDINAKEVLPGAIGYHFESYDSGEGYNIMKHWGSKGIAVRGIYCPWQKSDGISNLRCSNMIMEVATYDPLSINNKPFFKLICEFLASEDGLLKNIRPIPFATSFKNTTAQYYVGGVHNIATQSLAAKAVNRLAQHFFAGSLGSVIAGDMNVSAPIDAQGKSAKDKGKWPCSMEFGTYTPLLSGKATQSSGGQLDWAMHSFKNPKISQAFLAKNIINVSPFDTGRYSGYASSDHEILVYSIEL